jgi:hypothetical protein
VTKAKDPLARLRNYLKLANKLTNLDVMGEYVTEDDLEVRMEAVKRVVGKITSLKGTFVDDWKLYNEDPNFAGAHGTREKLRKYLAYIGSREGIHQNC